MRLNADSSRGLEMNFKWPDVFDMGLFKERMPLVMLKRDLPPRHFQLQFQR